MNELESLRRLTEAVETAKADIAPTYIEYVHLAFAIATDCGEEGRDFFHRLCRVSAKYQREHAERIFSNALTANHGDMHLGTVFYLAEAAGVTVRKEEVANSRTGTKGTAGTAQKLSAHTCARNKVYNSESPESEELLLGSEPKQPLPTFPAADWPELLQRIMSYGSTDAQNDVMLLGALTALGSCMERYVRCPYGGGQGIRFGLTDKSCSVGVHDVLQNTGAGIVARDEEHFVGRYLRGVYFRTFFAHCFVGGFGFFVGFYFFGPFGAELVMDRIHKQPY